MREGSETCVTNNSDGHVYDLRPKVHMTSFYLTSGLYTLMISYIVQLLSSIG